VADDNTGSILLSAALRKEREGRGGWTMKVLIAQTSLKKLFSGV
jgi:hypothetical protein